MGNLEHVQRGQPLAIPAGDWNKIIDATRAFFQCHAPGSSGNSAPATAGVRQTGVILVRNDSDDDQDRFAVLGIDKPIILPGADGNDDEFKRQVALSCVTPTTEHTGRFVILLEPLPSGASGGGGIGRACVAGVCVARVDVVNESDTRADVAAGDASKLISGNGSAQILWKEDGTGTKWAIVRLGDSAIAGFFAQITGHDAVDNTIHHFEQVDGAGGLIEGGITGEARELNGREGVPVGTMVWIAPWVEQTAQEAVQHYAFDLGAGAGASGAELRLASDTKQETQYPDDAQWDITDQNPNADPPTGLGFAAMLVSRLEVFPGDDTTTPPTPPKIQVLVRQVLGDGNGHIVFISPEARDVTTELALGTGGTDKYVAVTTGEVPGYLADVLKIDVADKWLKLLAAGGVYRLSHIGPDIAGDVATVTSAISGTGFALTPRLIDARGHVTPTDGAPFQFSVQGDDTWIQTQAVAGGIRVSHAGPEVGSLEGPTAILASLQDEGDSGAGFGISYKAFDAHGHLTPTDVGSSFIFYIESSDHIKVTASANGVKVEHEPPTSPATQITIKNPDGSTAGTISFDDVGHNTDGDDTVTISGIVPCSAPSDGDLLQYDATNSCWNPIAAVTQEVVKDVSWDGTSLKQTKATVKVLETVGGTTTVIDTAEDCDDGTP